MTFLPKAPRALFRLDSIQIQRLAATSDAEGNPAARTTVFDGRGTISAAAGTEQLVAAQRGTRIDKILSLEVGLDVQAGDFVVVSDGSTYEVVEVEPRRLYQRAMMRRVA